MNDMEAADKAINRTHELMESIGLTRPYYLTKLKTLCEATKPISCIKGKDADGGSVDWVDVPDNTVQLNAVKTVISLYGDEAPKKEDINIKGPLQIHLIDRFINEKEAG